ncbi:MAG: PIN domain-containing protein [Algoriphagus sp.]|nr:PIN domain-containing protein [Algoriphagus sp.]
MIKWKPEIVFLDANVLFSVPIRDTLLTFAQFGFFSPRWTDLVQKEWMRNVMKKRPDIPESNLERTIQEMNNAFPDAEVTLQKGFSEIIKLPDPGDVHVVLGAMEGQCSKIVTLNLKDFPQDQLSPFQIEAIHPDEFMISLLSKTREESMAAFSVQVNRLKNPPMDALTVISYLKKSGLLKTGEQLETWLSETME